MNTEYIQTELEKHGRYPFFYSHPAGTAVRVKMNNPVTNEDYLNALLPLDDKDDAEFVAFFLSELRRLEKKEA
jgi:hypothetical protein